MSLQQEQVDSRWWYISLGILVLFTLYVLLTPPDASLLSFVFGVVAILTILFSLFMDIQAIRRSKLSWNPSWVYYVVGSFFFPVFFLYLYRRYRRVGLT
jgi:hypothetical protein